MIVTKPSGMGQGTDNKSNGTHGKIKSTRDFGRQKMLGSVKDMLTRRWSDSRGGSVSLPAIHLWRLDDELMCKRL